MTKKIGMMVAMVMAIILTGCSVGTSKVKVTVNDQDGKPVANQVVYYTDMASTIISVVVPNPLDPAGITDLNWDRTNAQGVCEVEFGQLSKNMTYYFYVYDEGKGKWYDKLVTLKKGDNGEINFVVTVKK